MEPVGHLPGLFESFIAHVRLTAVLLGLLGATGIAQWLKFPLHAYCVARGFSPNFHRWSVRTVAMVAGVVVTLLMWPTDEPLRVRIAWAIVVGVMQPTAYILVMARFPWLRERMNVEGRESRRVRQSAEATRNHNGNDDVQ